MRAQHTHTHTTHTHKHSHPSTHAHTHTLTQTDTTLSLYTYKRSHTIKHAIQARTCKRTHAHCPSRIKVICESLRDGGR
uniref:Uncharacterized protein n=1 Tax=Anguilla anguilla TaxID=7936 RepID=A0A0E9WX01_ANGAN